MNRECKCGGTLGGWACKEKDIAVYKGLFQCIDCGKDYLLKDGELKFISKAEFRRIVKSRKDWFVSKEDSIKVLNHHLD